MIVQSKDSTEMVQRVRVACHGLRSGLGRFESGELLSDGRTPGGYLLEIEEALNAYESTFPIEVPRNQPKARNAVGHELH